jgi:hypothetical protein
VTIRCYHYVVKANKNTADSLLEPSNSDPVLLLPSLPVDPSPSSFFQSLQRRTFQVTRNPPKKSQDFIFNPPFLLIRAYIALSYPAVLQGRRAWSWLAADATGESRAGDAPRNLNSTTDVHSTKYTCACHCLRSRG